MVWQCGSNGLETCIERFCNADRMVLQRGSNGFATRIEWFCNTDRTVCISRSLAQKRTFTPVKSSKDVIIFTCCHKLAITEGMTNTSQFSMGSK